jgi:RsiW-degrading membrane proteinase PrsW (M82 family)
MACEIIGLNCSLSASIYIYALLGGVLPSLLWIWFWFHEENKHHEPKKIILMVFLAAMASTFLAVVVENGALKIGRSYIDDLSSASFVILLIWAFVEELFKYLAARLIAFRKINFIHPIDAFIYLTTASLGFSAMENAMLLIGPLFRGETLNAINAESARFMGASLLHFLTSGIIALFIGLTFYASRAKKTIGLLTGFTIAVLLHSAFNFFIINSDRQDTFLVFLSVWILVILLTISLERVKKIKKF